MTLRGDIGAGLCKWQEINVSSAAAIVEVVEAENREKKKIWGIEQKKKVEEEE